MRVLIVEDEPALAAVVTRGLRSAAFATDLAGDGAEALAKTDAIEYDLVMLDRDIPIVHGDEVCRQYRRRDTNSHGVAPADLVPITPS